MISVDFLELLHEWMEHSRLALFPITNSFHLSVPDMFEMHNTVIRSITFSEPERVACLYLRAPSCFIGTVDIICENFLKKVWQLCGFPLFCIYSISILLSSSCILEFYPKLAFPSKQPTIYCFEMTQLIS
jgi:hypothetical protein